MVVRLIVFVLSYCLKYDVTVCDARPLCYYLRDDVTRHNQSTLLITGVHYNEFLF